MSATPGVVESFSRAFPVSIAVFSGIIAGVSTRLSDDLEALLAQAERRPLTVREVEAMLQSRGFALLTMVLAAPFIIPSVLGLSTPFGLAIMLIGWRLMFGLRPWLPQRVLNRELPSRTLCKILRALLRLVRWMERFSRQRLTVLADGPGMRVLTGLMIVSGGCILFVPIPVPTTNVLPSLSILFLAAGRIERDGLFTLFGHLLGVAAWVYLGAWCWFGKCGVDSLRCLF